MPLPSLLSKHLACGISRLTLWAMLCVVWVAGPGKVWGQFESKSRSERKAEERELKERAKAEKKAMKEFEKNYKELQERHYKFQQTGREKNLVVPDGQDKSTTRKRKSHAKDNVKKRMRKGQQKARRHRDGRTVSWWRRLAVRRSWKKH